MFLAFVATRYDDVGEACWHFLLYEHMPLPAGQRICSAPASFPSYKGVLLLCQVIPWMQVGYADALTFSYIGTLFLR